MSVKTKKLNILVEIGHPAHIHFFKNIIKVWEGKGHNIFIVSRDKDITNQLLKEMGYEFISLTRQQSNKLLMFIELFIRWIKIYNFIIKEKIDIIISISGISTAVPGKLAGITTVTCTDTEDAVLSNKIAFKFSDVILVPESYLKKENSKFVSYKGFHELAYLYPARYKANPYVLNLFNLKEKDRYFIIRLVKLKALHDIGTNGITQKELKRLILFLEKKNFKILISSERRLSQYFDKYLIKSNYDKILNLMSFAFGYFGESPTMAMEAALNGKISIWVSNRTGKLGYIKEMEEKYNLIFCYKNFNEAFNRLKKCIKDKNILKINKKKLRQMLKEKIDVSDWIANFVVQYYNEKRGE